jgi:hypothetical protein
MLKSPIITIGSSFRVWRFNRWMLEANSLSACRRISQACGI